MHSNVVPGMLGSQRRTCVGLGGMHAGIHILQLVDVGVAYVQLIACASSSRQVDLVSWHVTSV